MEIQISYLKEDLEREQQKWRTAQANYERQVRYYVHYYVNLVIDK